MINVIILENIYQYTLWFTLSGMYSHKGFLTKFRKIPAQKLNYWKNAYNYYWIVVKNFIRPAANRPSDVRILRQRYTGRDTGSDRDHTEKCFRNQIRGKTRISGTARILTVRSAMNRKLKIFWAASGMKPRV